MNRLLVPVPGVGDEHDVMLPNSFALRAQLLEAMHTAHKAGSRVLMLVWSSAALGLCSRIGRHSGVRLAPDYDVLRYGQDVRDWLHERGVDPIRIDAEGARLLDLLLAAQAPTKAEVAEAKRPLDAPGTDSGA